MGSKRAGSAPALYGKWQGIHWALSSSADLGHPRNDPTVRPLLDRALRVWLGPAYLRTFRPTGRAGAYRKLGVPVIHGRARRCASQQGNALLYATKLGFADERASRLVELLVGWQWPDGGWNCDKSPEADTSSFMETLLPMRGLAAYAAETGDPAARRAAARASEVFLERKLFRRKTNGAIMDRTFLQLHYPLYWHYDLLGALKGMAEVGRITDPRCSPALDLLEEKELPQGGWPAEARYYRVSRTIRPSAEFVDWGGASRTRPNEWVTTDALFVLNEAGRLTL